MIGLDDVVGVLLADVAGRRYELVDDARVDRRPICRDRCRGGSEAQCADEELSCSRAVSTGADAPEPHPDSAPDHHRNRTTGTGLRIEGQPLPPRTGHSMAPTPNFFRPRSGCGPPPNPRRRRARRGWPKAEEILEAVTPNPVAAPKARRRQRPDPPRSQ